MHNTPASDVEEAAGLLRAAGDVTLLGHVNPDADALGSALALGLALHQRGARVRVSFAEPAEAPESLRSLDAAGLLVSPELLPAGERLLVAVDTPNVDRLGALGSRVGATIAGGGSVLVVDHHASNTRFGTHHVVDIGAEASAVLALRILDAMEHQVDASIANCLYAGLVTDTSSFRRASPETHRMAARLVEAGAHPEKLGRELMDSHPFPWLPMLSRVLACARLEPGAARGLGLVHTVVTREDAAPVRVEEVESVIDVVRATSEAEVAVVLKEIAPRADVHRWSVSLRAKTRLDVSVAAQSLGGGGHRLASGCTLEGSAEEVLAMLRAALNEAPIL
ncbi:MAG: DHH family phosphoesterase [Pseudonocardiaceae bacterium]